MSKPQSAFLMKRSLLSILILLMAPLMASAASPTRAEVLRTAEAFANHQWQPTAQNVLHGRDSAGIEVQTPDRSTGNSDLWLAGQPSVGVPYKWGGFDSLESFGRGIKAGKAGGDLYSSEKRRLGGKAVSASAVGLDCSGFVSRCWGLKEKQSTGSLADICVKLRGLAELRPGDVLNQAGGHVVLFIKWLDDTQTGFLCYEAEPFSRVRASERNAPAMLFSGFLPLRYRQIRD